MDDRPVTKARLREDLGRDGDSDSDEDAELAKWGTRSSAYYGADAVETEQDARDELSEAARLHKKHTQAFGMTGFGLDEAEWKDTAREDEAQKPKGDSASTVVVKDANELVVPANMSASDRLDLLKTRFPEFDDLAEELTTLHAEHDQMSDQLAAMKDAMPSAVALMKTRMRALKAYLGSLAMYFVILTSPASSTPTSDSQIPLAMAPAQIHDHPIMTELMRCRQLWQLVQDLQVEADDSEPEMEIGPDDYTIESNSESELEDHSVAVSGKKAEDKSRKSKSRRKADRIAREAAANEKAARVGKIEDTLSNLDKLLSVASKPKRKTAAVDSAGSQQPQKKSISAFDDEDDEDLGEPEHLTQEELRDKAQRRRSVRFHMSQIHQREAKDSRGAVHGGGDDDIPHRERWRDRVERLNKEAEARGKKQPQGKEALGSRDSDSDSDGGDDDDRRPSKHHIPASAGGDGDDDDEYYDMVAARRSSKLAQKSEAAAAAAEAKATKGTVVPVEEIGPDGKRKITYQIEKNKGLTVNRRKTVKNPRVKKRMKYDQKMKKLKSTRAVYGGGEERGGYAGERTGIKAGLIRSRKL